MNSSVGISDHLVDEFRRRVFEESYPRIIKCLESLSEAEIWSRPNSNSNSVGNLILHLCGNVRQWIISGLGKQPDQRKRRSEFETLGPISKSTLIQMLQNLREEVEPVLNNVDHRQLTEIYSVQCYEETGVSILIHVIEHFSYHVGQITYYVKATKDTDLKYYGDTNLG